MVGLLANPRPDDHQHLQLTGLGDGRAARRRGLDVVDTLEWVTAACGKPKSSRLDQGPEFVNKALDLWAYLNGLTLDFSREMAGSAAQNTLSTPKHTPSRTTKSRETRAFSFLTNRIMPLPVSLRPRNPSLKKVNLRDGDDHTRTRA